MKKTFLIAGLIACIGVTNTYAEIVISQTDENPDMVITVARAAKTKSRITPQTADTSATLKMEEADEDLDFTSNSGEEIGTLQCPAGCRLKCRRYKEWGSIIRETIRCICKGEFGRSCDVITGAIQAEDLR